MSEPQTIEGDVLTKLIQLRARRLALDLRWPKEGIASLDLLCLACSNAMLVQEEIWNGVKELCAMPEMATLPEPMQAKIMAIILKARVSIELAKKDRDVRTAKFDHVRGLTHPEPSAPA